jgi:hypothetical protein
MRSLDEIVTAARHAVDKAMRQFERDIARWATAFDKDLAALERETVRHDQRCPWANG